MRAAENHSGATEVRGRGACADRLGGDPGTDPHEHLVPRRDRGGNVDYRLHRSLGCPGQLWGELSAWGLDEPEERDKPRWRRPMWSLLGAGVVVIANGTIIYML